MERARRQLAALAGVGELLAAAAIEHWVFGGWAVDFYLGSVTRAHEDLDLAVRLDDLPALGRLLEADGWRHEPRDEEDGGTGYEREGVRLELTYVVHDAAGRVCTPLRHGLVPWPAGALGDDVRELHGVRARLVALPALVETKSTPRQEPDEGARDRADLERLLTVVAHGSDAERT